MLANVQGTASPDAWVPVGTRFRALREALNLSQQEVVARSQSIAANLGPGYEPLTRQVISHVENGRLHLTKDATRAILCVMFDLSRDELADYLDGKLSLEVLLRLASRRRGRRKRAKRGT